MVERQNCIRLGRERKLDRQKLQIAQNINREELCQSNVDSKLPSVYAEFGSRDIPNWIFFWLQRLQVLPLSTDLYSTRSSQTMTLT